MYTCRVQKIAPKRLLLGLILLSLLQISNPLVQVNAAEDPKAKLNRVIAYLDQSNRLIDSLNASSESTDSIIADLEDASDEKAFDALASLSSRSAEVRRKIDADNANLRTLSNAYTSECSKLDIGPTNTDLYYSVEDTCFEFADSNLAARDAQIVAEEGHSNLVLRLAEFSKAAASVKAATDAKAAADAKAAVKVAPKVSPKATAKATTKKAQPKVITCRKGTQVRVFDGVKCPTGWIKK